MIVPFSFRPGPCGFLVYYCVLLLHEPFKRPVFFFFFFLFFFSQLAIATFCYHYCSCLNTSNFLDNSLSVCGEGEREEQEEERRRREKKREEERRREKKRRRKRDRQEGEAGEKEEHDTATHRTIFPIISHVFHNPPFSLQLFLSTNTTRTHSHTVIASPSHNARSPLNTAQHSTQHTASSTQCLPRHCCSWCWQPL